MRIHIQHETVYRYAEPAAYSIQALRLKPADTANQRVLRWQVRVPANASMKETRDVYGNVLQMLYVERPHDEIAIAVSGEVETENVSGIVAMRHEPFQPRFYLRRTDLTAVDAPIAALAEEARAASDRSPLDMAHRLMERIRDALDYRIGETHAATTAAEALAQGSGVCQDHAHVFCAAARHLGIPARYVSGYLWIESGGEHEAGHAWAEAHIDGLGWVGFDVANRICPTANYVRVASGLDYLEAAPVRGLRRGGGQETLEVRLRVDEGAAQQ